MYMHPYILEELTDDIDTAGLLTMEPTSSIPTTRYLSLRTYIEKQLDM